MAPALLSTAEEVSAEIQQVDSLLKKAGTNRTKSASRMAEASQQALDLATQVRYRIGQASALRYLGIAYQRLGQYARSVDLLRDANLQLQRLDDQASIAEVNYSLGITYFEWANFSAALDYFNSAFDIAQQVGYRRKAARILDRLGQAYMAIGQFDLAERRFRECIAEFEQQNDRKGLARGRAHLAWVLHRRDNDRQASSQLLLDSLAEAQTLENHALYAEIALLRARLFLEEERYEEANTLLQQILEPMLEREEALPSAHWLVATATCNLQLGKLAPAEHYLNQAHELANNIGHQPMLAAVHRLYSKLFANKGQSESAYEHFVQYSDLLRQQLQENNATSARLLRQNLRSLARQKDDELAELQTGDLKEPLALLEKLSHDYERTQQALLDYRMHTAEIQQMLFADTTDLNVLWPRSFVTRVPADVVANSFIWGAEARESNLLLAVSCLGKDDAAGFLTGLLFTLLNEELAANLNNSLQTYLGHVDSRFQALVQQDTERNTLDVRYAVARIIKNTGTVQVFTQGLTAYALLNGQLQTLRSATVDDIHSVNVGPTDCLMLCTTSFHDSAQPLLHQWLMQATQASGNDESRAALEQFLRQLTPDQLTSTATPIVGGCMPLG